MMKKWIFNAILAAIAAVFAILQEKWLGTSLTLIESVGFGTLLGLGMSIVAEMSKKVFVEWPWSWKAVGTGAIFGLSAAIITALCV